MSRTVKPSETWPHIETQELADVSRASSEPQSIADRWREQASHYIPLVADMVRRCADELEREWPFTPTNVADVYAISPYGQVLQDHKITSADQLDERLLIPAEGNASLLKRAETAEKQLKQVQSELASLKALKALETADSFPAGDITHHRAPPHGPQIGYSQGYDGDET